MKKCENTIGGNKIYVEENGEGVFLDFGRNIHNHDKYFQPFIQPRTNRGIHDSSLRRPSASAGVAAVTPEGQYISGVSTPLENNTTDFIDVDKLAPNLLLELDENKFNKEYEYIVILRDGSPNICRQEVPLWKKHLEEYGKNFIFLASRKTHPYRVFPKDILEQQNKRRVDYSIPAVLNSELLPAQDFLVLAL